jgi:hypothetical protein
MWYAGMDRFHMREIWGAPDGGYEEYEFWDVMPVILT